MLRQLSQKITRSVKHSPAINLSRLIPGYILYTRTEGKSDKTITIVTRSVGYLEQFLMSQGLSTNVSDIGPNEFRSFILYLQQKRCFSGHRFTKTQDRGLSGHTINGYLRALRSFWSWLASEEIVATNPLLKMKIPKAPRKVIPTFSDLQLQQLLAVIDTSTPEGYRDLAITLTLLDTALRVSELTGITLDNLWLDEGLIKVMGKGGKERQVPMGRTVQRILWHYVNRYRPEPAIPHYNHLFLTYDGRPMTKDRIDNIMSRYGRKAGIHGVRCSPHTFRHSAAIRFLRSGGNVFTLQRLLGHSSLEMTRRYCETADIDVKSAHVMASPVDNFVPQQGKAISPVYPACVTLTAQRKQATGAPDFGIRALPAPSNHYPLSITVRED
ncbi:MAG: tyrosine-type recombinase/integrase [Dehalococcoidia bacterium]